MIDNLKQENGFGGLLHPYCFRDAANIANLISINIKEEDTIYF